MSKWLNGAVVAGAVLGMAGVCLGNPDMPSALLSVVTCECTADAQTGVGASTGLPYRCTISPSGRGPGEDINVKIDVVNVLGAPLAGSTVVVAAAPLASVVFIWDDGLLPSGDTDEDPQTKVSDVAGNTDFVYDEGGVAQATPTAFPNLDYKVLAQGPGPGGPVTLSGCAVASAPLQIISYDEDASGAVDLVDFAIFTAAYVVTQDPEADYNWTGFVNLVDFAMFASHYVAGASIDGQ